MNTVILAFYKGRKKENKDTEFFDRLICWVTRSRYSHVEVVTQYNPRLGTGVCWSASPRDNGVRYAIINLHSGHWELYEVPSDVPLQDIQDWFVEHEGAKYDWLGAFGSVLSIIPQIRNRWFCSEATAASMHLSRPSRTTPESLFSHFLPVAYRIPI